MARVVQSVFTIQLKHWGRLECYLLDGPFLFGLTTYTFKGD